jgi:hypothetical protein
MIFLRNLSWGHRDQAYEIVAPLREVIRVDALNDKARDPVNKIWVIIIILEYDETILPPKK